ncbi:MAG: AMP-binding protein, partial [Phycisphaerae bacterium]|nr:AMP-binding protein [Phycisphaerae bacterium]
WTMQTIPQIFEHSVRVFADRLALTGHGEAGEVSYTYRRLGTAAVALAERLIARGVCKGTHVAYLCENRPEWAVGYFAVHLAGAVLVPLDEHLTGGELRAILQRDRAPLLLVSRPCLPLACEATDGMAGTKPAVLEELLSEAPARAADSPPVPIGCEVVPQDTAVITFTSGTTSDSKGIVLTHRNIASNAIASGQKLDIGPNDRFVSILPLSHLFEQTGGLLTPLLHGASVAYPGSLNPRAIMQTMNQTRATLALVVPALARLFRKHILKALQSAPAWRRGLFRVCLALSRASWRAGAPLGRRLFAKVHEAFGGHIRFLVSGGGPLDSPLALFFMDLGLPVLQGYGLVEAAPVVACNTVGDHMVGSVGRPLPGVQVRIDPVESGGEGVGEILIRGSNVMA